MDPTSSLGPGAQPGPEKAERPGRHTPLQLTGLLLLVTLAESQANQHSRQTNPPAGSHAVIGLPTEFHHQNVSMLSLGFLTTSIKTHKLLSFSSLFFPLHFHSLNCTDRRRGREGGNEEGEEEAEDSHKYKSYTSFKTQTKLHMLQHFVGSKLVRKMRSTDLSRIRRGNKFSPSSMRWQKGAAPRTSRLPVKWSDTLNTERRTGGLSANTLT